MTNLIALLQDDHVHFLDVLETLEVQAKIAAHGNEPDHGRIRNAIAYFSGAPRRLHYRREEILLRMLERRAPHLAAKVAVILRYHRTLDHRLDDLRNCFEFYESCRTDGRAAFVTAAIRFAEFEKAHFSDEDEHLFPAALRVLTPGELDHESDEFRPLSAMENAPASSTVRHLATPLAH
jgi:hemerythrin-like domain-containing protein